MVHDGVQEIATLFHVTAVLHSSSLATLNANLTRLPQTHWGTLRQAPTRTFQRNRVARTVSTLSNLAARTRNLPLPTSSADLSKYDLG